MTIPTRPATWKPTLAPGHDHSQPAPWNADSSLFTQQFRQQIPYDGLVVGIIDAKQPQPDELLVACGLPDQTIAHWCETGSDEDALYKTAKRRGMAIRSPQSKPTPLFDDQHVMMHVLPECLETGHWWWMAITRQKQPFTVFEQQLASLTVRQWQTRFNRTTEHNTGRLLVGHDGRVIAADPWTSALVLHQPTFLEQLLATLPATVAQRWNSARRPAMRDLVVELVNQTYWICFHHCPAIDCANNDHWYLELRPLDPQELPATGVVADDRIARSIAYIHDHYADSPSLARVAKAVNISPFHFHRLFVKHVGVSPKQYVQAKQMQVARWMLRCSRNSIGTIASRSGFRSHGHFTSTFHRVVGMSPSRYRQAY